MPPAPAFGAVRLADKTLTSVNRRPSAPLRHGLVIVRRTERQDFQQGRPENG